MQQQFLQPYSAFNGQFKILKVLGSGSFGKVYLAYNQSTNQYYAIKQIQKQMIYQQRLLQLLKNQIQCLKKMKENPNVVTMYQCRHTQKYYYVLMEYCQTDLWKYYFIQNQIILNQKSVYFVMDQIFKGYQGLVDNNIIHRVLKPQNILIKNNKILKIADFGFSKILQQNQNILQTKLGTPLFQAPQISKNQTYTRKCDIWSLGVIFYLFLTRQYPWTAHNAQALFNLILRTPLDFKGHKISKPTKQLIQKMLTVQQEHRISWENLVQEFQMIKGQYFNNNNNKANIQRPRSQSKINQYNCQQNNRVSLKQITDKSKCNRDNKNLNNSKKIPKNIQQSKKIDKVYPKPIQDDNKNQRNKFNTFLYFPQRNYRQLFQDLAGQIISRQQSRQIRDKNYWQMNQRFRKIYQGVEQQMIKEYGEQQGLKLKHDCRKIFQYM